MNAHTYDNDNRHPWKFAVMRGSTCVVEEYTCWDFSLRRAINQMKKKMGHLGLTFIIKKGQV